jgi:hypothetical protein
VIWLTWRQHRAEALILGCVMMAAIAALALVDLAMARAFDQLGLRTCASLASQSCAEAANAFLGQFGSATHNVAIFVTLVPGVVGMFVGAPMVAREVDRRTHWLVWSQDISRGRWLLVKTAGLLLLGALAVGVFTLALRWMLDTFFQVAAPTGWGSPLEPFFFEVQGVVPVAAAVFALALGMAAGALLPRTLPAMLIVLVLFGVARVGVAQARFRYPPAPATTTVPVSARLLVPPGAWWVGNPVLIDAQGETVVTRSPCTTLNGEAQPACAGYRYLITYQPADRFWRFQAIESGIYLVLSVLLLVLTAYWVRRRIT